MFSSFRTRFGIPGVISVIALVFAMLGGAYAASNDGGNATASAKAKKGPRGPRGPRGPAGPAGPAGPQGPAGPAGAKGDTGAAGANGAKGATGPQGTNGTNGTSVANTTEPTGTANCGGRGGTKLVGTSTTFACNGEKGEAGEDGEDGETGFTSTLPVGKTETGTWAFGRTPEGIIEVRVPISFAIPLATDLPSANVHYLNQPEEGPPLELKLEGEAIVEVPPTNCSGTAAAPTADSGHLCVYTRVGGLNNATIYGNAGGRIVKAGETGAGASTAGAYLNVGITGAQARGIGTWAVTG